MITINGRVLSVDEVRLLLAVFAAAQDEGVNYNRFTEPRFENVFHDADKLHDELIDAYADMLRAIRLHEETHELVRQIRERDKLFFRPWADEVPSAPRETQLAFAQLLTGGDEIDYANPADFLRYMKGGE